MFATAWVGIAPAVSAAPPLPAGGPSVPATTAARSNAPVVPLPGALPPAAPHRFDAPPLPRAMPADAMRRIVLSNLSRAFASSDELPPVRPSRDGVTTITPDPDPIDGALDAPIDTPPVADAAGASDDTLRIALDDLSLRDAVGIAIARHPDIGRANAEVAQSTSEVEVAKSAWYPKIDYGVRPGYGGSFGSNGNRTGTRASIGVSQLLYDFGRTSSRISAADSTLSQRRFQLADTIETVAYQTASTFIELAASQDVIAAAQRQVAALTETRAKILDRVRAGLSVSSDRNLVELAILHAQAEVLKAHTRFDVAAAKLTELIGARPRRVAGLGGTVGFVGGLGSIGGNVEHTPSVLAAEAAVDAADARVRLAEAERFPSIGIGASRAISSGRPNASNDTWIGLAVSGNYSLGGLAKHQIAAAEAELRANRESLENQRLVTRSALKAAQIEVSGAAARRASYEKVIALSRASRDLYWQEYILNKRTLTDVVNPERDIFESEVEWINALADGSIARVKAYVAVGKFVELLREHEGSRHE
ncbi:TPA: TolC family protein [Burkholderia multivorans]|uniref:TolC family protein n=1 Tax=Burkholderia multivorans TaxID=87883 RepID=UPI001C2230DB|nr:TolC family protein [Burkholderia multivorans]MBU9350553.1 TolC family protein [Burkholderia multivorans]MBU9392848.1 TolC family protein [Burkholderia multivorans]HDR9833984.1 TolC family protein [Burkholderia multivorans]HDR9839857.1 TolC family protein [Burkholderia multivorans]HDR9846347.1 TolC family protein [Burkholderia multivorans]